MPTDWKDALSSLLANQESDNEAAKNAVAAETDAAAELPEKTATGRRTLRLFYEKKGRGGKPATIIEGFDPEGSEDEECEKLAATLKKRLGRGGSSRGGEILIQGDCREQLRKLLKEMDFIVKG